MEASPALEVVGQRLKAFLASFKPRLSLQTAQLNRLDQLRRVNDVRVRQFAVGKLHLRVHDYCGFLHDPKVGRFDALIVMEELLRRGHLSAILLPTSVEAGYVVEGCLLHQVVGTERMAKLLKAFVAKHGKPPEPSLVEQKLAEQLGRTASLPPAVDRLLGKVKGLWSMPERTARIVYMLKVPGTPLTTVAAEIDKDAALQATCLKVIRSASYGDGDPAPSVRLGVGKLARPVILQMVEVSALVTLLGRKTDKVDFDLDKFWTHSLQVARAAALVGKETGHAEPDEFFLAGLAHDVGKLITVQLLPKSTQKIQEEAAKGTHYARAERSIIGVNHAELGACLCEQWKLSPLITASVCNHLASSEVLEEASIPRGALVVAATCRLLGETLPEAEVKEWCDLIQYPTARLKVIREESAEFARACRAEVFTS